MMRLLGSFLEKMRARSADRRARALHRAIAETKLRETQEGSIWRSGKGGAHHDR